MLIKKTMIILFYSLQHTDITTSKHLFCTLYNYDKYIDNRRMKTVGSEWSRTKNEVHSVLLSFYYI